MTVKFPRNRLCRIGKTSGKTVNRNTDNVSVDFQENSSFSRDVYLVLVLLSKHDLLCWLPRFQLFQTLTRIFCLFVIIENTILIHWFPAFDCVGIELNLHTHPEAKCKWYIYMRGYVELMRTCLNVGKYQFHCNFKF